MPTEKDMEFVNFLLNSTQKGEIQWQPSAEENQFTTTLQQKYTANVSARQGELTKLTLTDPAGQELVSLENLSIPQVEYLYEFVRRQALDVDSVLNQIMGKKDLVIISARYGCRDHRVDVTRQLNDAMVGDKLHVFVGNQLAGDPCPNVGKDLILEYRFKEETLSRTAREGETLDLP